MDHDHFDDLTRWLASAASRRATLQKLAAGAVAIGLGGLGLGDAEARKKRKRKKKLKKNAFGCVNVGGKCRGKDSVCCSGICQGKKPKKGEKDKSKCKAHNVRDCPPGADSCQSLVNCTGGICYQTTGRASFCSSSEGCGGPCKKDADCGPGEACAVCPACGETGTSCVGPAG